MKQIVEFPTFKPLTLVMFLAFFHISRSVPLRVELAHIDADTSFTTKLLIQRAINRSSDRNKMMQATIASACRNPITKIVVPVVFGEGEYLMELAVGTPPQPFTAVLDTGSTFVWRQCKPCIKCVDQPGPLFNPAVSKTYSVLPCSSKVCRSFTEGAVCKSATQQCNFLYSYGDKTSTQGDVATETFTFGSTRRVSVPHLAFGCGFNNGGNLNNGSGIVGLGRGNISLSKQLGISEFSYCFATYLSKSKSYLFLGPLPHSKSKHKAEIKSTPILTNPSFPYIYYVALKGITVGSTRLPIPESVFEIKKNGSGGIYIDSGTAITALPESAYQIVVKAFVSQVKLPRINDGNFDLCFRLHSHSSLQVHVPKLIFHFEGTDMSLPTENYMVKDENNYCLVMRGSTDGSGVIGNFQQQNMHVVHDLKAEKLSFVPAKCSQI